ncbi:TatD family hydrolase [Thalassotalea psychrophila]|uniref:TatD family hydrolase n=1 Tax=Thalassotalea psychrophila TaxID=3065647 RepID=A0ABY9TVX6_9GAMM|nr:TatD family hydrolase [Colwelliaceae bacterium SQ149]
MIDIGVNLTNSRFDKDREDVIQQAQSAGIKQLIITGTNVFESQQALDICQQFSSLYCTAGVHPHDADNVGHNYLQELENLAQNDFVKAIGECGLDFNRNFSTPENQQRVFTEQLELAKQLSLPVFLHQRDAFNTWQTILKEQLNHIPGGVSHCFTGDLNELKACLDMGLYIGITGWICDERRGQELFDIAKYIPLERIMVETDAPYLTPRNIRPKPKSSRNEPKYLPFVVRTLAKAMKVDEDELIKHSSKNAMQLFRLAG